MNPPPPAGAWWDATFQLKIRLGVHMCTADHTEGIHERVHAWTDGMGFIRSAAAGGLQCFC
jgi:hypothetical protein